MSGIKVPVTYWDSCVFLAWLTDESPPRRTTEEVAGIAAAVNKFERRELKIVTSAFTVAEASPGLTPDQYAKLKATLQRPGSTVLSMDLRIAELARGLQGHYDRLGGKRLATPDALHLATAITYDVSAFYTFDGGGGKFLGLLPLSGNVADHPLTICKPPWTDTNLEMNFGPDPAKIRPNK